MCISLEIWAKYTYIRALQESVLILIKSILVFYANPFFLPSTVDFVHLKTACSFLVVLPLGGARGLQHIHNKLEWVYVRDGAKCTVDSVSGNASRDFLIESLQESIHIEDHMEHGIACKATSMQQSAEWGMRAFQLSMPRLKDWMKFESHGERRVT
jgi:hypothetical protein